MFPAKVHTKHVIMTNT